MQTAAECGSFRVFDEILSAAFRGSQPQHSPTDGEECASSTAYLADFADTTVDPSRHRRCGRQVSQVKSWQSRNSPPPNRAGVGTRRCRHDAGSSPPGIRSPRITLRLTVMSESDNLRGSLHGRCWGGHPTLCLGSQSNLSLCGLSQNRLFSPRWISRLLCEEPNFRTVTLHSSICRQQGEDGFGERWLRRRATCHEESRGFWRTPGPHAMYANTNACLVLMSSTLTHVRGIVPAPNVTCS